MIGMGHVLWFHTQIGYGVILWEFQRKLPLFTAQPQSTIKIKQNRAHISWDILRSISTSLDNNNKIVMCNRGVFFHASVNLNLYPYPPLIHKIHPKDIMMMTFHEGPFHITGTACNEASDWLHRLKIECHHDANFCRDWCHCRLSYYWPFVRGYPPVTSGFSSQKVSYIVMTSTATSDEKVGIMMTLSFQCWRTVTRSYDMFFCHAIEQWLIQTVDWLVKLDVLQPICLCSMATWQAGIYTLKRADSQVSICWNFKENIFRFIIFNHRNLFWIKFHKNVFPRI